MGAPRLAEDPGSFPAPKTPHVRLIDGKEIDTQLLNDGRILVIFKNPPERAGQRRETVTLTRAEYEGRVEKRPKR